MPLSHVNGQYTPVSGAETAASGQTIASATWNSINTDYATVLTMLGQGAFAPPTTALTLTTGLNSNITLPATARNRIAGPSGAFSVGGFTGGQDGTRLYLYNSTTQTMTIVNEDASSLAINRIHTLNGQNFVLEANNQSFATLSYDATDSRWILESDHNTATALPSSSLPSIYTVAALAVPLSAVADAATFTIPLPSGVTTFTVQSLRVGNANSTVTPAIALYTAASAGGVNLIASTSISIVTGVSVAGNALLLTAVASTSPATNVGTVYLRVVTAASISATADFMLQVAPIY